MSERTEPPSVENLTEARRAIEAMLLVANDPTPVHLLAQLVELPVDLVQSMCRELAGEYEAEHRGFQLVEVAGGWRYQTHPDTHAHVERFALEGIPNRLSNAALETLAIVAYKQPISRAQIGAIRGVNVDGVLRTLVQRGYVDEKGRDHGPGQATLFGTTPFFLEQLGLMSLDDLPPLGDFVPSVEVLEALENTLRVDLEPEIVIVDDDHGGHPAAEAKPDANGAAPAATNGSAINGIEAEPAVPNGDAVDRSSVDVATSEADEQPVFEIMGDPTDHVISPEVPVTTEHGVLEADAPDELPTDELEVAADPGVDMTDRATATGAFGADDARFPGARSTPPIDDPRHVDAGEGSAANLGRRASAAAAGPGRQPGASTWSETVIDGLRDDADSGDA